MSNKNSLRELQMCILSIAKDLDKFCRENNIHYYLMGGSALGAMRHKGFIPWDDDMDIFMDVENYRKFLELYPIKGDTEKYFIQKENTPEWPLFISRICLKGTTLISDEFAHNMKQHHNVFVDIMCLYSTPQSEIMRKLQYTASQLLRVNALERMKFAQNNTVKCLIMKISCLLVNKFTRNLLNNFVHKFENKNSELVGHFYGRARYKRVFFKRKYIGSGKPRYVPFEDTELPVFEHAEDYLTARFGSHWNEMPNKKIRDQYPIHGNFVDLEKDYTEYMTEDGKQWTYK